MNVVAIVQARMGSSRLPGKVMLPLGRRPMIHHVLRRAQKIEGVDEVVMATSRSPREEALVRYVRSAIGLPVVRGPEDDVLERYVGAARQFGADVIVRLTADCPLLSARVSSRVVQAFVDGRSRIDYASNTLDRTYPRGLDTEVFSVDALRRANRRASNPWEREHVTLYMWSHPELFELQSVKARRHYPDYRWTVDTFSDYRLLRRIFDVLLDQDRHFEFEDALQLLENNPQWTTINDDISQKPPSP